MAFLAHVALPRAKQLLKDLGLGEKMNGTPECSSQAA
jgi:hypothetical protein